MDEDKRLRGASSWQYKPERTDRRLGEEIVEYLEQHNRSFEKNAALLDLWPQAVPAFLQDCCRPGKRTGNTLFVEVTPGPYMHQVQMYSGEILENLKHLAPRCGIRKLRLVPKLF